MARADTTTMALTTKWALGGLTTLVLTLGTGIGWRAFDGIEVHAGNAGIHESPASKQLRVDAAVNMHATMAGHAVTVQSVAEINRRLGLLDDEMVKLREGQGEILQALAAFHRGGDP